MAMVEAAKILRKHLNPFVQYNELGSRASASSRTSGGSDANMESKLNMTLADLRLSVRATNCLESENMNTVRDLVSKSEDQLLEVRNFGETTLKEVREKLSELGLRLGMRVASPSGA
jgi:DNA-directed RNA polymerase subunit alpha